MDNMNAIQPREVATKQTFDQKELRELLHVEIEKKSKYCSNPTFDCSIPRLDGYEYCIRHILKDSRAPFRPCTFTFPNGKKCPQAAPKHDIKKDPSLTTYCFEHSRLAQLTKTRNAIGKFKQIETNEVLLNNLSHHLNIEPLTPPTNFACELDEEIDVVSPNIRPFVNYDQISDLNTVNTLIKKKRRILDYASDSSSDAEPITVSNIAKGHEWDNSDDESVDSQDEDLLKHAGIYTNEEAIAISKKKLINLQNLYMEQINRLHHILKEKRRKYLHAIRKERETLCSIHDQPKQTPAERKLYDKLKALNHYHRRHGVEAVLHKKFKDKRSMATEGYIQKTHPSVRCIFTEGGVKCGEKAMPSCKYCKKHILEDKKQILFRACNVEKSGVICQESVPNIFEDATCVLHINLPAKRHYDQKRERCERESNAFQILNNCASIAVYRMLLFSSPISNYKRFSVFKENLKTKLFTFHTQAEINLESETEEEEEDGTAGGAVTGTIPTKTIVDSLPSDISESVIKVEDDEKLDTSMDVDVIEEPNKNVTISHDEKPDEVELKVEAPPQESAIATATLTLETTATTKTTAETI